MCTTCRYNSEALRWEKPACLPARLLLCLHDCLLVDCISDTCPAVTDSLPCFPNLPLLCPSYPDPACPALPQGVLRIAHCGGFHNYYLNSLVAALNKLVRLLGKPQLAWQWDSETMGCSPSMSSIPARDQR